MNNAVLIDSPYYSIETLKYIILYFFFFTLNKIHDDLMHNGL